VDCVGQQSEGGTFTGEGELGAEALKAAFFDAFSWFGVSSSIFSTLNDRLPLSSLQLSYTDSMML